MTNRIPAEKWWERLSRIIGGWAVAVIVLIVNPETLQLPPDAPSWLFVAPLGARMVICALGMSFAHSTVSGIVFGNAIRFLGFVRGGFKEPRQHNERPQTGEQRRKKS